MKKKIKQIGVFILICIGLFIFSIFLEVKIINYQGFNERVGLYRIDTTESNIYFSKNTSIYLNEDSKFEMISGNDSIRGIWYFKESGEAARIYINFENGYQTSFFSSPTCITLVYNPFEEVCIGSVYFYKIED